jgi:hypothetical protein
MLTGVLISESLRDGGELRVPLECTRIWRSGATGATGAQPETWTLMEFRAPREEAERLAEALAGCLLAEGGWYTDFHTPDESFVVFADRIFRYPRGDTAGRAEAERYARSVGVPESQLDWAS